MREKSLIGKVGAVTKIQLYKTISYRVISSAIGFFVLWISTGRISLGIGFSIYELMWKPIQYFLHEKIWQVSEKRAMKKQ